MQESNSNLADCYTKIALKCILPPLKIKQIQTVFIFDRKLHHKTFLLSVENAFYPFDVQNCFCCGFNQSSRLALLINELATYVFIYTSVYSPGSQSNKSTGILVGFQKCGGNFAVYSSFRHTFDFDIQ